MRQNNNSGPAFPLPEIKEYMPEYDGMSLRDWFAGQLISGQSLGTANYSSSTYEGIAKNAYRLADAMLAEREKEPNT